MKNSVSLIGNLGADPELKRAGDQSVVSFRVATTRRWKTQSGERRETTDWHSVEVWGKQAELCAKYLSKGHLVGIEGRLQTDQWEDKATGQKRERTKVVASEVHFLHRSSRGTADAGIGDLEPGPIPVD